MQGSNITVWIAFAAGILSFLSPCVLPLVPGYISLMSGVSIDHLKGEGGGNARRELAVDRVVEHIPTPRTAPGRHAVTRTCGR
jgi:cytochrome c-type biogenesis protein